MDANVSPFFPAIMNVVRYASLQALEKGDNLVTLAALERGIRREKG